MNSTNDKSNALLKQYKTLLSMSESEKSQFWQAAEQEAKNRTESERKEWQEAISYNLVELKAKLREIDKRIVANPLPTHSFTTH